MTELLENPARPGKEMVEWLIGHGFVQTATNGCAYDIWKNEEACATMSFTQSDVGASVVHLDFHQSLMFFGDELCVFPLEDDRSEERGLSRISERLAKFGALAKEFAELGLKGEKTNG